MQAQIGLGGEQAQLALTELEQVISKRKSATMVSDHAVDGLGDGLTVLLILMTHPSPKLIQRTLASAAVYPLLATLVLQCQHHRAVQCSTSSAVLSAAGLSLQNILRMFLCGSQVQALEAEATFHLPEPLLVENLLALLVLTGRIPAAAELNWRAVRRPLALYNVQAGVACLAAALRNVQNASQRPVYAQALQLLVDVAEF